MIKANNGKVKIKGGTPEVLTDMTLIIKSVNKMLIDNGLTQEEAKEVIAQGYEMATMTEKELELKLLGKLMDVVGKIYNEKVEDENKVATP